MTGEYLQSERRFVQQECCSTLKLDYMDNVNKKELLENIFVLSGEQKLCCEATIMLG